MRCWLRSDKDALARREEWAIMRPAREVTAEEEGFRMERRGIFMLPRRNSVEPEPVGTIVLKAFRITGYDPDCDGSLMARLENIGCDGEETGWAPRSVGIYPDCDLVVTPEELAELFAQAGVAP